ncbi:MAG TPA: IS200/IS605 family transposase [Chloroflexia bacterium]|nr:IS200/IS605 family transposase [Chloroflexia bacterium]
MREFKSNNHVMYSCQYHLVWCPKYRRKVLVDDVDTRLQAIIAEVCTERGSAVLELEIRPDHVHLVVECDPQFGIHRLVKLIKGRSSFLLRSEFPALKRRLPSLWTNAYFVCTVGGAPRAVIDAYVAAQKDV